MYLPGTCTVHIRSQTPLVFVLALSPTRSAETLFGTDLCPWQDTLCGKLLRSSGSCVQKARCVFIRLQCTVGRGADYVKLNAPAPVRKVFILCALKQPHNALFLKQGRICISCPSELHSLTHSLHFSANEQRWIEWSRPCRGKAPCRQNQAQDP